MNCYALEISDVDFSQSSELPVIRVAELTFLEASGTELQVVELPPHNGKVASLWSLLRLEPLSAGWCRQGEQGILLSERVSVLFDV